MFKLKRACENCPFRKSVRFPLRRQRVVEIIDAGTAFQCHATLHGKGADENGLNGKGTQQCAGLMLMLTRSERPNAIMRLAAFTGDLNDLIDDHDVFAGIEDCLAANWWL